MSSDAQINANRENARLSTGPTTDAGRSASSKNATKHSLTGATVLLPDDDLEAYQSLLSLTFQKHIAETEPEKHLVQQIADTEWRLLRITRLEAVYFEKALTAGDNQPSSSKDLMNLSLYETRLQRKLEKKTAEFKELRSEREIVQTAHRDMAMKSIQGPGSRPHRCVGFEFSLQYLIARVEFTTFAKNADVALFDRTWRDKSSKTPG